MKHLYQWMLAALLALLATQSFAQEVLLGAGDMLKISVYANPDLSFETKVSEAGKITFPLIGDVLIDGLTASAAEKKIAEMLRTGGFVRNAQVNIVVTTIQSNQISVLGQVQRPGRYPIDGKRSITDMLAVAGGIGPDGGETITVVRTRDGKSAKRVIDLIDMVRQANLAENYDLQSGDLVYVERYPRFYIYGEVQRGGVYRLEKNMTIIQALSSGGGITLRGTERHIRVKRRDAEGVLQIITARPDDLIQPDDVLYIQESLF